MADADARSGRAVRLAVRSYSRLGRDAACEPGDSCRRRASRAAQLRLATAAAGARTLNGSNRMALRVKPLQALFIVVVIDVLGFGIVIPLIPYMAAQFGASPALNTWILGIYSFFQLLAAPLWGRLSDRFGRRPI